MYYVGLRRERHCVYERHCSNVYVCRCVCTIDIAIDINQGAEIDPVLAPPIDVEDDDAASSSSAASLLVLVASAVAASISVC